MQQLYEYQGAGFTTVIGGGSGPKGGPGIECPGVFNLHRMLEAMADIPLNFGNFGKGNAATKGALAEQIIIGGATGLKIHEDWSSSPALDGSLHQVLSAPTNRISRSRSMPTR